MTAMLVAVVAVTAAIPAEIFRGIFLIIASTGRR